MAAYTVAQHEYQIQNADGSWPTATRQDNMSLLLSGQHQISGLTGSIPAGGVRVRAIAIAPAPAGDWLYSKVAFTAASTTAVNHLVKILGQSNAGGKQNVGNRLGMAPFANLSPALTREFERVFIWTPETGTFQKLHVYINNRALNSDGPAFGAELGLAQDFEERNPTGKLYIIKDCGDGQTIQYFMKPNASGEYDRWKNDYVGAARANLAAAGVVISQEYFYWCQGEANTGDTAYESRLTAYMADLIADGINGANDIQVICGCKYDANIRSQEISYVMKTPVARYVNTDDYTVPDTLHYGDYSQFICGYVDIPNAVYSLNKQKPFSHSGGVALPTLTKPTNFRLLAVSTTGADFTCDAVIDATGYRFRYADNAAMTQNVVLGAVQQSRTFSASGLASGKTIYAQAQAIGDGATKGNSAYCDPMAATTSVPVITDETVQESDPRILFSGAWAKYDFAAHANPGEAGFVMASNDPNAYCAVGFSGRAMKLELPIFDNGCTQVEILLNNLLVDTYNGNGAGGTYHIFTTPDVTPGPGNVVKIRPAAGASGYAVVDQFTAVEGHIVAP